MFGDYGYNISAEMGKQLDYLTKLYLVKALSVRKIVLETSKQTNTLLSIKTPRRTEKSKLY